MAQFGDCAEAAHQRAAAWAHELREEAERSRALRKRVLSDVVACTATCFNTLARTANEASPYRQPSEVQVPPLPEWRRAVPPRSGLTQKEGTAERQAHGRA